MNEDKLRDFVREELLKINKINEYDLLAKKKSIWLEKKQDIKKKMFQLLKNIENDDYKDGIQDIKELIELLKDWKNKIEKHL